MVSVFSFIFDHLGHGARSKPNFGPRAAVLPLLVVSLALAACSDKGGGAAVDQSAQVPAQSWAVALTSPDPTCVQSDKALPLEVIAYDNDGNVIPNPRYVLSSSDRDALESNGDGSWLVRGEGPLQLNLNYAGPRAPGADIGPVGLDLTRDGTAPAIVIDSPARGVMLTTATPTDAITITGSVEDALTGISGIMVNGEPLDIAGTSLQEAIDVQRAANWGTNVITVEATDRCLNVARHSQSFLQSSSYLRSATAPEPGARADGALVVGLTQEAVDDGNREDLDDLTTLAEGGLNSAIPAELERLRGRVLYAKTITGPFGGHCDYSAVIPANPGPSSGPIELGTTLGAGFTDHVTSGSEISVGVRYRQVCYGPFGGFLGDISATFTHKVASFSNRTQLNFKVDNTGLPAVTVNSSSTVLSGLSVNSSSNPTVAAAVSFLFSTVNSTLSKLISPLLEAGIKSLLPDQAGSFFADIAQAAVLPISFPPPFDLTLNVNADWDRISVSAGEMTQVLGQYVYPSAVGTPHHPAAEGAISAAVPPRSAGASPEPITFALSDDGINQMLWAFWYGGGLELPNLEAYAATLPGVGVDLGGVSVSLSGLLPPVLMPGADSGGIVLGLGDLRFEGSIDLALNASLPGSGVVAVTGYAALLLDAAPAYNIAGNTLVLQGDPAGDRFHLHLESITMDGLPVSDAALREAVIQLIEGMAPPTIRAILEQLAGKVNLPLLALPLPEAAFGPDRSLILDIVQVRRDGDRFVVDIDPDDSLQIIPNLSSADWDAFALVALDAARIEAGEWLDGAYIWTCKVDRDIARGKWVLDSSYRMTGGVKDALTAAGAPDVVARNWNWAFTIAWAKWSWGVDIPSLSWYPEFRDRAPMNERRNSAGNTPTPLGDLVSSGREAMSPEGLKARLLFYLDDGARQAGVIAFADDLGARMDDQLRNSLVQNVSASAVYIPPYYNPDNRLTWFPAKGPLRGTCEGGEITPNFFSLP